MLADGYTPGELQAAVIRGDLHRLLPGSYVPSADLAGLGAGDRYLLRIRAAAHRSPRLVVSHLSAVALFGLPLPEHCADHPVHLTRRGQSGAGVATGRVVHAATLADTEVDVIDDILVTALARTLIDTARQEPLTTALPPVVRALELGRVSEPELQRALDRVSHRKGAPAARRVLARADRS